MKFDQARRTALAALSSRAKEMKMHGPKGKTVYKIKPKGFTNWALRNVSKGLTKTQVDKLHRTLQLKKAARLVCNSTVVGHGSHPREQG